MIGALLVIVVVGATGASIQLQRNEAVTAHRTAISNRQDDGSRQTIGSADAADRMLNAIGTEPNPPDVATTSPTATESDPLANWPLQVFFVLLGAVSILIGVAMLVRFIAGQIERMESSKLIMASKNAELEAAHRQLDAALANISLGIYFADSENKLVVCNEKYREIYHLPLEATRPGMSAMQVMDHLFASGNAPRLARDAYASLRDAMIDGGVRREAVVELTGGQFISVTHNPMPDGGWVATHEDITERRRADGHIRFLAHHDVLTGLANRTSFAEKLDAAVARLHRHGSPFVLFMLDLDRFKNVNDTLGHLAGDQLLRETAQRLKSSLPETVALARLGGDEFAILQTDGQGLREETADLAARIIALVNEPLDIDGNLICVGASIGIALAVEQETTSSDILKMADLALYTVKASGRNDFCFFEAEMLSALNDRRNLEAQLRLAITRGEFELHYQALIDVSTGRQTGFEALVRWTRPDGGRVMPDQFIPIAEETGLIVPLGDWILRRACADAANWPSHIKVAVNLSPVQLEHPDLFQSVQRALAESALPPERLELEITETALFKNDADCEKLIRRLKGLGITIALDDFGTGYSSLSYLTMMPFDKIKIDRSFTMNMTGRTDCAAIVAAVVALGHNLNTQTVAEGVETEEQLVILRAAGVTMVQGYLFGKPCPASALMLDGVANRELSVSAA